MYTVYIITMKTFYQIFTGICLTTFSILPSFSDAQQNSLAAGGNSASGTGMISYSVGQIVYTVDLGSTGSVAQGVQQPYEISVLTFRQEQGVIELTCSVFPNPASEYVILKVTGKTASDLSYKLYDATGKLLESKTITNEETVIIMKHHVSAIYYLFVMSDDKEIKVFKILKK
jgi:hypothetical protein